MFVECLFWRHRGQTHYWANQRAPTGRPGLSGTSPCNPHPESQAALTEALLTGGLAWARIVSRHWGPPRACYRVPYCGLGDHWDSRGSTSRTKFPAPLKLPRYRGHKPLLWGAWAPTQTASEPLRATIQRPIDSWLYITTPSSSEQLREGTSGAGRGRPLPTWWRKHDQGTLPNWEPIKIHSLLLHCRPIPSSCFTPHRTSSPTAELAVLLRLVGVQRKGTRPRASSDWHWNLQAPVALDCLSAPATPNKWEGGGDGWKREGVCKDLKFYMNTKKLKLFCILTTC